MNHILIPPTLPLCWAWWQPYQLWVSWWHHSSSCPPIKSLYVGTSSSTTIHICWWVQYDTLQVWYNHIVSVLLFKLPGHSHLCTPHTYHHPSLAIVHTTSPNRMRSHWVSRWCSSILSTAHLLVETCTVFYSLAVIPDGLAPHWSHNKSPPCPIWCLSTLWSKNGAGGRCDCAESCILRLLLKSPGCSYWALQHNVDHLLYTNTALWWESADHLHGQFFDAKLSHHDHATSAL